MNLFWLARKLRKSAHYHCNAHITKIPTEAVQLLYSALILLVPDEKWRKHAPWNGSRTRRGYLMYNAKHPLVLWVAASRVNYMLCAKYAIALCKEYTARYGKKHAAQKHARWLMKNVPSNLPDIPMTPIPILPLHLDGGTASTMEDAVKRYRKIYIQDKLSIAQYKAPAKMPKWLSRHSEKQ